MPATGALQQAVAGAAPLPLLDVNDPTAKALKYVVDAKKVDPKANPTFKPGQNCANCVQFQGQPTDKQAPCPLFVAGTFSRPVGAWSGRRGQVPEAGSLTPAA